MSSPPPTASRESSEFEFVPGNNCPATGNVPGKTAGSPESLFGWVKGSSGGLLSKMAEKTKISVENVITTLDPQMKDYINSGGDINVVVATDNDVKVAAVRHAFQAAFGKATVRSAAGTVSNVAVQPVGFAAACQAANERIESASRLLQRSDATVVAVEDLLFEIGDDEWVDVSCLTLADKSRGIRLTAYSQPTRLPAACVAEARRETPDDYPMSWSGLAVPVGPMVAKTFGVKVGEWHEAAGGVSQMEIVGLAAKSLAHAYKKSLLAKVDTV